MKRGLDMNIFTVVAVGIVGALFTMILKQYKPEYALVAGIATSVAVILPVFFYLSDIFTSLTDIISKSGIDRSSFVILFKALGISFIASMGSETCADAGMSSAAGKIELAGKVCMLVLCLPLLSQIVGFIGRLLSY